MRMRPWWQWIFLWMILLSSWWLFQSYFPIPPWVGVDHHISPLTPISVKPLPTHQPNKALVTPDGLVQQDWHDPRLSFLDSLPNDFPRHWRLKGQSTAWFSLQSFFQKLPRANHQCIEVYHWGDSQIEGDRISGSLRHAWQTRWGGNGPGWILPVTPAQSSATIESQEGNILRQAGFGTRKVSKALRLPFFAINLVDDHATWSVQGAGKLSNTLPGWTRSEVWLNHDGGMATAQLNNTLLDSKKGVHSTTQHWDHVGSTKPIQFELANVSILGMHLATPVGVLVHNIPLRGSSGTLFAKIPQQDWDHLADSHPPELILLQFGGNAVPGIQTQAQAQWIGKQTRKNLLLLRSIFPNVPIIFIGPSDMGQHDTDYPGLPWVIDELTSAALETGAMYWDLRAVMGGSGSMSDWVNKGWASKDHIHLTRKGANEVAKRLETAIHLEWKSMMP